MTSGEKKPYPGSASASEFSANGSSNPSYNSAGNIGTANRQSDPFKIEIPSISLPNGGGAIKSIDEKFDVNAVTGTASFSVPISAGSARGFGVSLAISYNSGIGNSVFGLGWGLSLTSFR